MPAVYSKAIKSLNSIYSSYWLSKGTAYSTACHIMSALGWSISSNKWPTNNFARSLAVPVKRLRTPRSPTATVP